VDPFRQVSHCPRYAELRKLRLETPEAEALWRDNEEAIEKLAKGCGFEGPPSFDLLWMINDTARVEVGRIKKYFSYFSLFKKKIL
jgi:hypothetical protein